MQERPGLLPLFGQGFVKAMPALRTEEALKSLENVRAVGTDGGPLRRGRRERPLIGESVQEAPHDDLESLEVDVQGSLGVLADFLMTLHLELGHDHDW